MYKSRCGREIKKGDDERECEEVEARVARLRKGVVGGGKKSASSTGEDVSLERRKWWQRVVEALRHQNCA